MDYLNTEHRSAVKIGVANVYKMKTQNGSLSEGNCANIRYIFLSFFLTGINYFLSF
jgi:hypothetical protein